VKRYALPETLVGPDLVVERKQFLDLLGKGGRLLDLSLVEMLVLERAVEALDHAGR